MINPKLIIYIICLFLLSCNQEPPTVSPEFFPCIENSTYDGNCDTDGDQILNFDDTCPYGSDNDIDWDGVCGCTINLEDCPEQYDACPYDFDNDIDQDGVCGDVDVCPGYDDNQDEDNDNIPDGCDECLGDPLNDCCQATYIFTTCNNNGYSGPNQSECNDFYSGTSLNNLVTIINNGVQSWTVPVTSIYTIEVVGAAGGDGNGTSYSSSTNGGDGAKMTGEFMLQYGDVIYIVVGQKGEDGVASWAGGGGGGSFVWKQGDADPLIIAGGGGGAGEEDSADAPGGTISESGVTTYYAGGTNGNYGSSGNNGWGGAGWNTYNSLGCNGNHWNGGNGSGCSSYNAALGGFGGGGAGFSAGGGGGGYSGGGAGYDCTSISSNSLCPGGGGGSINLGTFIDSQNDYNSGDGQVTISCGNFGL